MGKALEDQHKGISKLQNSTSVDKSVLLECASRLPVTLLELDNNADPEEPITINDKSGNTIATVTRETLSGLIRQSASFNVPARQPQPRRSGIPQVRDSPVDSAFIRSLADYHSADPLCRTISTQIPSSVVRTIHHQDFATSHSTTQHNSIKVSAKTNGLIQSASPILIRRSIRLNDRKAVEELMRISLVACPQNVLKPILKTAVKFIEPEKQRKWPYVLSEDPVKPSRTTKHRRAVGEGGLLQPPWWPEVRHREPDHLYKHECVDLGVGLLWYIIESEDLNKKHGDEAARKYWIEQVERLLPSWVDACVNFIGKDVNEDVLRRFEARRSERQKKAESWKQGITQLFKVVVSLSDVAWDRMDDTDLVHVEYHQPCTSNPKRKKFATTDQITKTESIADADAELNDPDDSTSTSVSDAEFEVEGDNDTEVLQEAPSTRLTTSGRKRKASYISEEDVKPILRNRSLYRHLPKNSGKSSVGSISSAVGPELRADKHRSSRRDGRIQIDLVDSAVTAQATATDSPNGASDIAILHGVRPDDYEQIYRIHAAPQYVNASNMVLSTLPPYPYETPSEPIHAFAPPQEVVTFMSEASTNELKGFTDLHPLPIEMSLPNMEQQYSNHIHGLPAYIFPTSNTSYIRSYPTPPMSAVTPDSDMKPFITNDWSSFGSAYSTDTRHGSYIANNPREMCCSPVDIVSR